MQRSRRALLQRRATASEKKRNLGSKHLSYKASLSIVLLLWGIVFLLNFVISHGNDSRDEVEAEAVESYHETQPDSIGVSDSRDLAALSITSDRTVEKIPISEGEAVGHSTEVFVPKDGKASSSTSIKEQAPKEIFDSGSNQGRETLPKSDRLSRVAPPGLDEFKNRAIAAKEKPQSSQTGAVVHRLEPGGKEYNYASAKKGAKVLYSNKEAKGASTILDKDKDKYLRNPCSAEEKYVVIELSEETLVYTVEIGNFEHYSSNVKDFELYSSPIYPTDNWVKLGNFTAQNMKHAQRFALSEPKWARYLKLNLLSHYGSEFYCTLSVVEVYGVDAVEKMLEEISVETKRSEPEEQNTERIQQQEPTSGHGLYQEPFTEISDELPHEIPKSKMEVPKSTVPSPVQENRPLQVGRIPGDAVLKILLQKVQSLDLNFSVLERYLEELNSRYAHIFKDFDDDMSNKDLVLENIRLQLNNLQNSKNLFAKEIGDLHSWKSLLSSWLEQLAKDNMMLRSEFERVRDHQVDMENKGLVVIFVSFIFGCIAAAKLFIGIFLSIFKRQNSIEFCRTSSAWFFLLLNSSIIAFILVI